MHHRRLVLAGIFAMAISTLTAAASDNPSKLKVPEIKYETYTMPNGLQVILS